MPVASCTEVLRIVQYYLTLFSSLLLVVSLLVKVTTSVSSLEYGTKMVCRTGRFASIEM